MGFILEQRFKNILRRYGHDILFQRCLNSEVGNATPIFDRKLERWTAYSVLPGGSSGIDTIMDEAEEGNVFDVDMLFYFQAEVNPSSGDQIYEEMDRYPDKQAAYSIDFAQPMRGVGGKMVFWQVGATRVQPI